MTSSALSGLPPLPKSLSGMLNPGDSMSSPHGSAFRPIGGGAGGGGGGRQRQSSGGQHQQSLYANTRPRSQERSQERSRKSPSVSSISSGSNNMYVNTAEVRASSYSPSGGRKWTQLDSKLAFLRQEMVNLRQMDMDLLCKFWALNEKMQEYKAQSRNSSLSPHDWLEQDEAEEGESEEEYYPDQEDPEDPVYIQPYGRNGQTGPSASSTPYRNGHGNSASRLKPLHERSRDYGSNSSLEYGDI